jgi:hypothetical protein
MTRLTLAGIAAARQQSQTGNPTSPNGDHSAGWCLWHVEEAYGVPHWYGDATAAWENAQRKHPTSDPNSIPRGVPIYWTGGSSGHGHIAISAGDGHCWSTDIKRTGFFDRCPIDQIRQNWGLTLAGWSEDLAGVTIYHPRTKADERKRPAKKPAAKTPAHRDPQPAKADAKTLTRPERAADNLEHVQGKRREKKAGRLLGLLHRLFPKTRRHG